MAITDNRLKGGSSQPLVYLQGDTERTIINASGVSALSTSGTAAIATTVTAANEATDTTCFPVFVTAATGNLGAKTNAGLAFNSASGMLTVTGVTAPLTGNVTGLVFGNVSSYNTDTAIAVTDKLALLDSSGAVRAWTLADGTEGQTIMLKCSAAGNNGVVTPANLADGSTLTFDAAGEVAILVFDGTNWQVIYNTSTLA